MPDLSVLFKNTINKVKPCDVLLSCSDSDRSYVNKNTRYSPVIDSFLDFCQSRGIKTNSVSDRISIYAGEKSYGNPYVANRNLIFVRIIYKFIRIFITAKTALDFRLRMESKIWYKVLTISKPRLVVGIQPDYPLCLACNQLKIPVYDLQHGVITDSEDNQYYYSGRLSTLKNNCIPTGFLVWDEQSKNSIKSISKLKNRNVEIIGNLWYERFLNPKATDTIVSEEKKHIPRLDKELPVIIVTLQYKLDRYAPDYVPDGVMTESLRETICNTQNTYQWIIRLHPSQLIGKEKDRINTYLDKFFGKLDHVHWLWCSTMALPVLLSMSKVHITHFSSTTIEATWMNLPTILLDPHIKPGGKHSKFYQHERDIGFAYTTPLETIKIENFIKKIITHGVKAQQNKEQGNDNLSQFIEKALGIEND